MKLADFIVIVGCTVPMLAATMMLYWYSTYTVRFPRVHVAAAVALFAVWIANIAVAAR